jgi:hypothetical protein
MDQLPIAGCVQPGTREGSCASIGAMDAPSAGFRLLGWCNKASDPSTTLVPGKGAHRRVSLVAALGDGGKTPPWSTTADTEGPAELVWLARHAVYGLA